MSWQDCSAAPIQANTKMLRLRRRLKLRLGCQGWNVFSVSARKLQALQQNAWLPPGAYNNMKESNACAQVRGHLLDAKQPLAVTLSTHCVNCHIDVHTVSFLDSLHSQASLT